jgi:hypothetical protein
MSPGTVVEKTCCPPTNPSTRVAGPEGCTVCVTEDDDRSSGGA